MAKQLRRDWLERIGAIAPDDLRDEVHEVREYRNGLVHEGDREAVAVSLPTARSRLHTFFARLPDEWNS